MNLNNFHFHFYWKGISETHNKSHRRRCIYHKLWGWNIKFKNRMASAKNHQNNNTPGRRRDGWWHDGQLPAGWTTASFASSCSYCGYSSTSARESRSHIQNHNSNGQGCWGPLESLSRRSTLFCYHLFSIIWPKFVYITGLFCRSALLILDL